MPPARGARIYAELVSVASGRAKRVGNTLETAIGTMIEVSGAGDGALLVISGASGAHRADASELAAYARRGDVAARAFSTLTGHLREAQFFFAVALAALAVAHEAAYPAFDTANEASYGDAPDRVLATTVGYHYFEGIALVARAD